MIFEYPAFRLGSCHYHHDRIGLKDYAFVGEKHYNPHSISHHEYNGIRTTQQFPTSLFDE